MHGTSRRGRLAGLPRQLSTLPNQLTALRLALVPLLWVAALLGEPVVVGIGVAVAGTTDVLDGWLSRRRGETSAFGSRLDSVADHLLAVSTALWMALLRPEFFRREWPLMVGWAAFALMVLGVSLVRFGRAVDLHLYLSKAAVFLAFCFAVPLLVLGGYSRPHFYLTLAVCVLAAAEALAVILTRGRVDEHLGSILLRRRRPADGAS
ncbi:MAG TPA: CDP-alcohol phosphatidyltransferase family protein [Longimicrobiaceae bacterium]|nr:CDP-alcohol phosphatidyltransferase family protein [Longimicrobiaceae bacterium]